MPTTTENARRTSGPVLSPMTGSTGSPPLYPEKKKVAASFDLIDLAGVSYGEVKNSLYLSALRKADGLVHVVRGFRIPIFPIPRE